MCCQADTTFKAPCINISWSALQQHVLISNNSRVRKNDFLSQMNMKQQTEHRTSRNKTKHFDQSRSPALLRSLFLGVGVLKGESGISSCCLNTVSNKVSSSLSEYFIVFVVQVMFLIMSPYLWRKLL